MDVAWLWNLKLCVWNLKLCVCCLDSCICSCMTWVMSVFHIICSLDLCVYSRDLGSVSAARDVCEHLWGSTWGWCGAIFLSLFLMSMSFHSWSAGLWSGISIVEISEVLHVKSRTSTWPLALLVTSVFPFLKEGCYINDKWNSHRIKLDIFLNNNHSSI